ncbi:MAG: peptidylprolyl isomerase [Clostridia bacterium]|nr:peptidylprolyl isomerase [Clostridia bacterium]MDY5554892.1 peptidylprolyl isomerase [Blautia sp.]
MKSKILAAVCTIVISAGLLSGCGNNDQTDSTAKSEETTEAAQEETTTEGAQEETADEKEGEQAGFSDGGSDSSSETTESAAGESGTTVLDTSSELTGIHHAEIVVKDYGTIDLELDADTAPVTVTNFVKLAQDKFYDGLTFHRIMDGFMIQGGDPNGNGTGGSDENIKGEFSNNGVKNDISHTRGTISMARASDPDSGSSQFFIVQADSTFLDGDYAGFGHVTEGMDVVDKICKDAKPTDNNGTIPADQQPVIESVRILD